MQLPCHLAATKLIAIVDDVVEKNEVRFRSHLYSHSAIATFPAKVGW